tara:strand:- start:421 stop:807 length:387 start_codon:yes stop_codon:yes gene_type:complete
MVLEETVNEEETTSEPECVSIEETLNERALARDQRSTANKEVLRLTDVLKRELPVGVTIEGNWKVTVTEKTTTRVIGREVDFKENVNAYLIDAGMSEDVATDMTNGIWHAVREGTESVSLRQSINPGN